MWTTAHTTDGAVGLGAVTAPLWLQSVVDTVSVLGGLAMLAGGLVLLYYRIRLARREWEKGERE